MTRDTYVIFNKICCDFYTSVSDRFLLCCFLLQHVPLTWMKYAGCIEEDEELYITKGSQEP